MKKIATVLSEINHYGSTIEGPVPSTFQNNLPNFVKIENVVIVSQEDLIDTPSHSYDIDGEGNPIYHSHSNQNVDDRAQSFVKIEGNVVLLEGDKNSSNNTIIDNAQQNFVKIET